MKKLVKPMLVECEEGTLHITDNDYLIQINKPFGKLKVCNSTPQQLVLVSLDPNDEIGIDDFKKIIATQDQLSPEYIKIFVKEYNKGVINPINIEIEHFENDISDCIGMDGEPNGIPFHSYRPKLTNGFITIVSEELPTIDFKEASLQDMIDRGFTKTIYTEEEVLELCLKAFKLGFKLTNNPIPLLTKDYLKDWFNKNKK